PPCPPGESGASGASGESPGPSCSPNPDFTSCTTLTLTTEGITRLTSGAKEGIGTPLSLGSGWLAGAGAELPSACAVCTVDAGGCDLACCDWVSEFQNGKAPARAKAITRPINTPQESAAIFLNIQSPPGDANVRVRQFVLGVSYQV